MVAESFGTCSLSPLQALFSFLWPSWIPLYEICNPNVVLHGTPQQPVFKRTRQLLYGGSDDDGIELLYALTGQSHIVFKRWSDECGQGLTANSSMNT